MPTITRNISVVLASLVLCLSAATIKRNALWHDSASIWVDASRKSPLKARTHFNTGVVLKQNNRLEEAFEEYSKAAALFPGFTEAFVNRGNLLDDRGETDRALADYDRALAILTTHTSGRYNRALAYERLGRLSDAVADYRVACEQQSQSACDALTRLGHSAANQQ